MKKVIRKTIPRTWILLYRSIIPIGFTRRLLLLFSPVCIGLLMKRNDYTLKEDLAHLCIFTACIALWWYRMNQKQTRHAQLRKPLFLEGPPKEL